MTKTYVVERKAKDLKSGDMVVLERGNDLIKVTLAHPSIWAKFKNNMYVRFDTGQARHIPNDQIVNVVETA